MPGRFHHVLDLLASKATPATEDDADLLGLDESSRLLFRKTCGSDRPSAMIHSTFRPRRPPAAFTCSSARTSPSIIDSSLIFRGPVFECRIPTRIGLSTCWSQIQPYHAATANAPKVLRPKSQRRMINLPGSVSCSAAGAAKPRTRRVVKVRTATCRRRRQLSPPRESHPSRAIVPTGKAEKRDRQSDCSPIVRLRKELTDADVPAFPIQSTRSNCSASTPTPRASR